MTDTTTAAAPATVDDTAWTEENVREIESLIQANLVNTAKMLILGIEAEFHKIVGDATAAAWVTRVLKGTGFTFRKDNAKAGELNGRDKAICALIKAKATTAEIADALGIGLATVHRVKVAQGLESTGGNKSGAGRTSNKPETSTKPETSETPATSALSRAAGALESVDKLDPKDRLDAFAMLVAQIEQLSGMSAAELATRGAALMPQK